MTGFQQTVRLAIIVLLFMPVTQEMLIGQVRQPTGDAANAKYRSVLIEDVPHENQKSDFCGEACTAMYLQKLGHDVDQDFVFDQSGLDPLEARGCYTRELATAVRRIGFNPGDVWYRIDAGRARVELDRQFAAVHADMVAGIPSILCTHFDRSPGTTEHFRLFVGYDSKTDELIYHDPAVRSGRQLRMDRSELYELWPLKYQSEVWTLIRIPLRGDDLNVDAIRSGSRKSRYTNADFAQHIMKLKKKIPDGDFQVRIQEPFVVIGDESPELLEKRSTGTVKWAVDRIKQLYFDKDPDAIIDVWLFKDKESYEKNCVKIFGSKPGTPYGYYSSTHRALVMNISTGGGTLVHEIVHPFIESNFADCPSWFNEGLASLYEQSSESNGEIVGLTNWRLRGLQLAIRDGSVPTFETLCGTSTDEFYNRDPGTNYSQARYLCHYLQQHGLLVKFYHAFKENSAADQGGYETLQQVLGRSDMKKFQQDWDAYVLALRFGQ